MIGIVNETERRQFLLNVGTACAGIPNAGEFEGSAPTPLYDHIPLPALPFGVIAKEKPPSRPRTADFRAEVGELDVGHIRVETDYGDVRFCSSRGLRPVVGLLDYAKLSGWKTRST